MNVISTLAARAAFRCGVTTLLVSATIAFPVSAQEQNYDPAKVAQEFHSTDPNLRIIVSHRGLWKNYHCPENSHCSVYSARTHGVEAVELDVKRSKSGTLWALHDYHIGRVTTYRPADQSHYFDQSKPTGPGNENALVADLTDAEIRDLFLRYEDGSVSKTHPYALRTLLEIIRHEGHLATMLDLKTTADIEVAALIVRSLHMEKTVILKFPSALYDPVNRGISGGIPSFLNGLLYVPVVYAQDLPRIDSQSPGAQDLAQAQDHVRQWLIQAQYPTPDATNGSPTPALYIEYGLKSPSGKDPLHFAWKYSIYTLDQAVGGFQPVPDASGGRFYLDGGGYFHLNDFLAKNIAPFPNETTDDRENSDFMLQYCNSIITDEPLTLIELATKQGKRAHIHNLCFNDNCTIQ